MFARIAEQARRRPDRVAVSSEAGARTFAELIDDAERFAALFASGAHQATVMIALPSGAAFTAAQIGGLAAGAIVAPVPDKLTPHEAQSYVRLLQPDVVVVPSAAQAAPLLTALGGATTVVALDDDARPRRLRTRGHTLPPQTRHIQFTSGSTGAPKGILLGNDNLLADLDASRDHLVRFDGRDVFCPIPQFHAMGNAVVLEHLGHGSPVHMANRFLPGEDLARMVEFACMGLLASPNYYKLMLKLRVLRREAVPQLVSMTLGTASVDQALIDELRGAFPDVRLHIRYGLSEAVGPLTRLDLEPGERLLATGLIGPTVAGVEIADGLCAPGEGEARELRVRHGTTALGQLTDREQWAPLVAADGYLATGDLAHLDARRHLHLRGRLSAFIKYNGYRVNAFEIETVLRAIDGVQEAVAIGVPDDLTGERIVVCLEASPGRTLPPTAALLEVCRAQLSTYKVPQEFRAMEALPRTPAGKPDRAGLRAQCGARR